MPFGILFGFGSRTKPSSSDSALVKTLTTIRVSGYNPVKISAVTDAEYELIQALVKTLGMKILKTKLIQKDSLSDFREVKFKFHATIDNFIKDSPSKFSMLSFAAQLLQYYTIICDDELMKNKSLSEFNSFLVSNESRFGNTSKNVLIAELKLIKLYNDMAGLTNSLSETALSEEMVEENIQYFSEQLLHLNGIVKGWVLDAPDNVFVHYLNFVVNYCFSKILELEYYSLKRNPSSSTDATALSLSDTQQSYLNAAKTCLDKIENLFKYF